MGATVRRRTVRRACGVVAALSAAAGLHVAMSATPAGADLFVPRCVTVATERPLSKVVGTTRICPLDAADPS